MGATRTLVHTSQMKDTKIKNPAGEKLGHIKDMLLDLESGKIVLALMDFGGFLGLGKKHFAIPWQSFRFDMENGYLILDMKKETLENAPDYGESGQYLPTRVDRETVDRIHKHYGHEPYYRGRAIGEP